MVKTKALISFAVTASLFSPMQIVGFSTRRLISVMQMFVHENISTTIQPHPLIQDEGSTVV